MNQENSQQAAQEQAAQEQERAHIQVILASGSPRRREILEREGIPFQVRVSEVDETLGPDLINLPEEAAKDLAQRKAGVVVQELLDENFCGHAVVIGADTVVAVGGRIFGKPEDEEAARAMLASLSGRAHRVITGVSVWLIAAPTPEDVSVGFRTLHEVSFVRFKELSDQVIAEYVATGEPLDKAGAYAIQGKGAHLVERYDGDFDNTVGLPVGRLLEEFSEIFEAAR